MTFNVAATGTPLFYQWRLNGTNLFNGGSISGATSATLTLTNLQFAQAGNYSVIVSNAERVVISSNALLSVIFVVPLMDALDRPDWTWSTTGTPAWFGQTNLTFDGVDSAQSGTINDSGSTAFQTTITGPGTVSFWWKVSSETNKDILQFSVGGTQQASLSGEADWQQLSFSIPSGSQALKWTYSKNSSLATGQDRCWVDLVQFTAVPATVTTQPLSQTVDAGTTVNLSVTAAGTPPFSHIQPRPR